MPSGQNERQVRLELHEEWPRDAAELRGTMDNEIRKMPLVALRNLAVLPGMLIHFDVSRKFNIAALEAAMKNNLKVFLVMQREADVEEPQAEDLYEGGTTAVVKQIMKLPGGLLRVLVSGEERGMLLNYDDSGAYPEGEVAMIKDEEEDMQPQEREAMIRSLQDLLQVYLTENAHISKDTVKQLMSEKELGKLIDLIAANIPMALEAKQMILEETDLEERFQDTALLLANEVEVIRIKKDLQLKVKEQVDQNQREYILREQLKAIKEELGENNTQTEAENYRQAVAALEASDEVKEKILKEIARFENLGTNNPEANVSRGYIDTLLELPWDKMSEERADLKHAKKVLEREHYGLEQVKERVLEFLAVRIMNRHGESPILCLVGPPGTGKTSIARSVAEALGKEYVRICLGGVRDEAEIRGHRRTYIGAMPGRIAVGLKTAKVKNPLMLLDEIDKVSSDYKGDTSSALLEVLDGEQNSRFVDHYVEIPIDLSEVLFIATANTTQTIPKPLLDRMEVIEVGSYSHNEKLHIAKEHLLAKQRRKNGLEEKQLKISTKAMEHIISGYTREAGVRSLERRLGEICRKAARELLEDETKKKISVTDKNLERYLGKEKYHFDKANAADEVGIVRGLAWTSVGGDTLQIEVNVMSGKGNVELTGQLGDVMKESARAGISYIRSIAEHFEIAGDFFEKHDLHIHIPEGAVPKDGPSAGITMATAMISAITGKKVKADLAMTGEITLRGRVLPIGGLKEKVLAAKEAGIHTIVVPDKNRADIEELAGEITDGIRFCYAKTMEDVLKEALVEE